MSVLICPVCGEMLENTGKSYICPKRHSFDIARSGYVNLLLSKHTGKAVHGDNKLMVQARRVFLNKGYYAPLCEAVCEETLKYAKNSSAVLDAGCGEGFYTSNIRASFDRSDIAVKMYGIDISKVAVEYAAKRDKSVRFAAASVFHLPVASGSCDMLVTMFAPYCGEEYSRVLKKSGVMIMAIPAENHLWELKKAIYETPYRNEVKPYELEGFEHISARRVSFTMELRDSSDIRSLFSMTPYYYKTGRTEQERLEALAELTTQADFEVLTYRKK
ncbi:23S rRNA (guanine745-N1)-methyltransferase [Ruminococcus sp. YRD2003]|uniref:putative RNA methyltransferase n=1 Tax=Ruminococcus sp. YRD2003 TaxID=1452313 RepID=UPI0008CCCCBC|nr:23S rRNA (guanine745-N1)-methyltransferase [Ruminococcus flavefaciens]